MKLTKEDKRLLQSWGVDEKNFAQIEEALKASKTKYELNGKSISREKAIELLGRKDYLSSIVRSAFHFTTEQETQTGDFVSFDSSNLFR